MSDPYSIFKNDESRQETLKILWPDLYECLARLDEPEVPRVIRCVLGGMHGERPWPVAVGRIYDEYGHPACRTCLDKIHGVGHAGWPLKVERKAKR